MIPLSALQRLRETLGPVVVLPPSPTRPNRWQLADVVRAVTLRL